MKRLWIVFFLLTLLTACGSNPTADNSVELANKQLSDNLSPVRVTQRITEDGGAVISYHWAGEEGVTAADDEIRRDVLALIEENCGLQPKELQRTNIVLHSNGAAYEVWIFNDEDSRREDKTTGLSVILRPVMNTGGTDINILGACHA